LLRAFSFSGGRAPAHLYTLNKPRPGGLCPLADGIPLALDYDDDALRVTAIPIRGRNAMPTEAMLALGSFVVLMLMWVVLPSRIKARADKNQ
jgi:hypothetical protein